MPAVCNFSLDVKLIQAYTYARFLYLSHHDVFLHVIFEAHDHSRTCSFDDSKVYVRIRAWRILEYLGNDKCRTYSSENIVYSLGQ